MNTHRLREYIARLDEVAKAARKYGARNDADKLDELVHRLRVLADEADGILSKIGNPPSDIGR